MLLYYITYNTDYSWLKTWPQARTVLTWPLVL